MPFILGHRYSRQDIHAQVGGDLQSYLPHVEGTVVCGCFDPAINARAPFEIDIGEGRDVVRYAERLSRQQDSVPVFLRRGNLDWEYVGMFTGSALVREAFDLYPIKPYRRPDAHGVLYLSEVIEPEQSVVKQPGDDLVLDAMEGEAHLRTHIRRERSFALAEAKRRSFRAEHGELLCEVCNLAESSLPSKLGDACFEVHHLQALAVRPEPRITKLDDLALVCANCHRMLHRAVPMLALEALRLQRAGADRAR